MSEPTYEEYPPPKGCDCDTCVAERRLGVPEGRHEFHLHGDWSAYCICGWSGWVNEDPWTEQVRATLAQRYREHL